MSSYTELCEKDVINVCDGKRIGCITNLGIDFCEGKIVSIYVTESGEKLFSKGKEVKIPWACIECIGEDTVLVKVHDKDKRYESSSSGKKKSLW